MIKQSNLPLCYAPKSNTAILSNDLLKSKDSTPKMKNHMVFCNKCRYYVGAWDKGDYYQCSQIKSHKIKKEVSK